MNSINILITIFINLISALIGFYIGNFWRKFQAKIMITKKRKFWQTLIKNNFYIVMPRFKTDELQITTVSLDTSIIFDPSGFLAIGDAISITELKTYFSLIEINEFLVLYADSIKGDELKSNLILIGGPNSNVITEKILERLNLARTIVFSYLDNQKIVIRDNITGVEYCAYQKINYREDYNDYCLIIKALNPFSPSHNILIVAGGLGYGTWGGIRFITSNEFYKNKFFKDKKYLECLIKVEIVRETPQSIDILALRALDN